MTSPPTNFESVVTEFATVGTAGVAGTETLSGVDLGAPFGRRKTFGARPKVPAEESNDRITKPALPSGTPITGMRSLGKNCLLKSESDFGSQCRADGTPKLLRMETAPFSITSSVRVASARSKITEVLPP